MKAFFVWFLLAWLAGLALGVVQTPLYAGLAVGAAVGAFLLAGKWPAPYAAASVALVLLGFCRVPAPAQEAQRCSFSDPLAARVAEPVLIEAERVQVVVESEKGCRAMLYAGRFSEVREGDDVLVSGGSIQGLAKAREFSEGYADYLERRGISATWLYPDIVVTASPSRSSRSQDLYAAVRGRVNKVFNEPAGSIALAMLLADEGTLPEELVEQYRRTGISHILAISGFNISLLAGLLLIILLNLPISPWVRTAALLVILWTYIFFIGLPTSAVRAAVFWTLALLAFRLRLLTSLPAVLLVGSAMLITALPGYYRDIGWQLSVAAVGGIWLTMFLARPWLEREGVGAAWRWLAALLLATAGATLFTAPIIVYHFKTIALGSLAANLLVVPVVPALTVLLIVALGVSFVFMPAALLLAYIVQLLVAWLDLVTGYLASVPHLFWEDVVVPGWALLSYAAALIFFAAWLVKRQGRSWREVWE